MKNNVSISYRPEIDALRGLAIVSIVLFHAGFLPGGFVGVDVFFVISGYLLTRSSLTRIERGDFTVLGFYAGRVRRLVPAALFMGASVGLACLFLPAYVGYHEFREFRLSLASAALCLSNGYVYHHAGDYFALAANNQLFLHTWFLSTLVQFLFFFPFLLLTGRRLFHGRLDRVISAALLTSFVLALVGVKVDKDAAYYLLPTRAWEILLGAWLAASGIAHRLLAALGPACTPLGLALVLLPALLFDRVVFPVIPGGWAMLPCAGAALWLLGTDGGRQCRLAKAIAANRPLVALGAVSYPLYLWHWPLLVLAKRLTLRPDLPWSAVVGLMASALALAIVSSRYVEVPWGRRLASLLPARQLTACLGCALALAVAAFAIQRPLAFTDGYADVYGAGRTLVSREKTSGLIGLPSRGGRLDFLLLGDSHGAVLIDMLDRLARKRGLAGRYVFFRGTLVNGHWAMDGKATPGFEARLKEFIVHERPRLVVIAMRWTQGLKGYLPHEVGALTLEHLAYVHRDGQRGARALEDALRDTVAFLMANGTERVDLILPVPENSIEIPRAATILSAFHHLDESAINLRLGRTMAWYCERNDEALEILRRVASDCEGVSLVDPTPALCPGGEHCLVVENGRSLYMDDDHLSFDGAGKLGSLLVGALSSQDSGELSPCEDSYAGGHHEATH